MLLRALMVAPTSRKLWMPSKAGGGGVAAGCMVDGAAMRRDRHSKDFGLRHRHPRTYVLSGGHTCDLASRHVIWAGVGLVLMT